MNQGDKRHIERFGIWAFDATDLTLNLDPEGAYSDDNAEEWGGYHFDLREWNGPARILDSIFQIRPKNWATPQVLADLLLFVDMVFHPQQNFCPNGEGRPGDPAWIVAKYVESLEHPKEDQRPRDGVTTWKA